MRVEPSHGVLEPYQRKTRHKVSIRVIDDLDKGQIGGVFYKSVRRELPLETIRQDIQKVVTIEDDKRRTRKVRIVNIVVVDSKSVNLFEIGEPSTERVDPKSGTHYLIAVTFDLIPGKK